MKSINEIVSEFRDYARTNMYTMSFPMAPKPMVDLAIKNTNIPSMSINAPELIYRGFNVPTQGVPTLGAFPVTFVIDIDFEVYKFFKKWFETMNNVETGDAPTTLIGGTHYGDGVLQYVQPDFKMGYKLTFINMWPTEISEITLNEENNIMEFTVNFKYSGIKEG